MILFNNGQKGSLRKIKPKKKRMKEIQHNVFITVKNNRRKRQKTVTKEMHMFTRGQLMQLTKITNYF